MSNRIYTIPTDSILGHAQNYIKDPLGFLNEHSKKHGDLFRFRIAHRYLIFTNNPDHVKHVLQENHGNFRKNLAYRKLKLLLGDGLFTSEGSFWRKQRRLAQPAFHKDRMDLYAQSIINNTKSMLGDWDQGLERNQCVNLTSNLTNLTLKIISKTLLGLDVDKEGKIVEENLPLALSFMMKRITKPINLPVSIPLSSHVKFRNAVSALNQLIEQIIIFKKASDIVDDDLLSMLISVKDEETGESMSAKQLRDEVITIFLAGHETSAMALNWAIFQILQNQSVLAKFTAEIQGVDFDNFTALDLKKLKYTKQLIQESMRLIPPVWILGREALGDDSIGGFNIKKKNSIIFSPYLIHRNPKYWANPECFDPERFNEENEKNIYRFSYFPFGGGPRLCIGQGFALMEMQIILAMIFQKYRLEPQENQPQIPCFQYSLTLRPQKDYWIKIKKNEGIAP